MEYLAGYFDAKGSVIIAGDQLKVTLSHRYRDIFQILKEKYGGGIVTLKRPLVIYNYQITGNKAAKLLRDLLPYLRLKKDIVECALNYQDTVGFSSEDVLESRGRYLELFKMLKEVHNARVYK
jgi:hypothetical protein